MNECLQYEIKGKDILCTLCPHRCVISEGKVGICKARVNRKRKLYSLTYGRPEGFQVDPVEKKPLYHFYPGTSTLSFGTLGCNLSCDHCQNYHLSSNAPNEGETTSKEEVVALAKENHCRSISFTYNEPTIYYEYMLDIAHLARSEGIKTIMVSNGFIEKGPAAALAKVIDAANIDIKSIEDAFYQEICHAHLAPVLDAVRIYKENGVHIEITNLIIPGRNDDSGQIQALISWVREHLGPNTPLHFTAVRPMHRMRDIQPTPPATIERACREAKAMGMNYVYAGNTRLPEFNDTICPGCGKAVIVRKERISIRLEGECCPCGEKITGRY